MQGCDILAIRHLAIGPSVRQKYGRLCVVYPHIVPMDVDDFIWPLLISLSGLRRVECGGYSQIAGLCP
jgi:hypothetical protein